MHSEKKYWGQRWELVQSVQPHCSTASTLPHQKSKKASMSQGISWLLQRTSFFARVHQYRAPCYPRSQARTLLSEPTGSHTESSGYRCFVWKWHRSHTHSLIMTLEGSFLTSELCLPCMLKMILSTLLGLKISKPVISKYLCWNLRAVIQMSHMPLRLYKQLRQERPAC